LHETPRQGRSRTRRVHRVVRRAERRPVRRDAQQRPTGRRGGTNDSETLRCPGKSNVLRSAPPRRPSLDRCDLRIQRVTEPRQSPRRLPILEYRRGRSLRRRKSHSRRFLKWAHHRLRRRGTSCRQSGNQESRRFGSEGLRSNRRRQGCSSACSHRLRRNRTRRCRSRGGVWRHRPQVRREPTP